MPCALGPRDPESFFNVHLRPRKLLILPWRLGQRSQWRIAVHYIAGASYPLRIVLALAPVLPNLISPASMVTPC